MNPRRPFILKPKPSFKGGIFSCLLWGMILVVLCHPYLVTAADSPRLIPFQGQVANQAGAIVADGQYTAIFNFYDQAVGGQPVWSERHTKIGVTRGMLNVFLGSISSLEGVNFSQAKYLGITVDTDNTATTADPEMVPRSVIIPAFHAKKAEEAVNAQSLAGQSWSAFMVNPGGTPVNDPATGFLNGGRILSNSVGSGQITNGAIGVNQLGSSAVTTVKIGANAITLEKLAQEVSDRLVPAGTIHAFGGDVPPAGYLACDGASVNRTTYAALFAAVGTRFGAPSASTFNLPDLRGQFLRGAMPVLTANASGSASGNAVTTVGNHPFNRTGMRVRVSGNLTTGLALDTDYYIVRVSATSVAFSATPENARTGSRIAITGSAAGMVITQSEDPDLAERLTMFSGATGGVGVGSVQPDEFRIHSHEISFSNPPSGAALGSGGLNSRINVYNPGNPSQNLGRFPGETTGGNETRPTNVSVNYIIKF